MVTPMISSKTKTASAAVAGAVVLAFGAYTVGSQAGDGSATAAQETTDTTPSALDRPGKEDRVIRREFRRHRQEMFSGVAKKLGVERADLRKALRDVQEQQRREFTKLLADKLGVDESKVKEALPERPRMKFRRLHRPPGAPAGPPPGPGMGAPMPPPPAGP
jgi:hypothetical protein